MSLVTAERVKLDEFRRSLPNHSRILCLSSFCTLKPDNIQEIIPLACNVNIGIFNQQVQKHQKCPLWAQSASLFMLHVLHALFLRNFPCVYHVAAQEAPSFHLGDLCLKLRKWKKNKYEPSRVKGKCRLPHRHRVLPNSLPNHASWLCFIS